MHIHQVGPPVPVARTHTAAVALPWNSGSSALIVALVELLFLALLLLRWLVRRQGGRRRAWRALSRQVRLTWGAFSQPVRDFLKFRASVRHLTRLLSAGATTGTAQDALDGVDAAVAPGAAEAYGFAVRVAPARRGAAEVAVHLAGRRVPQPAAPWRTEGDARLWFAAGQDLAPAAVPGPTLDKAADNPDAIEDEVPRMLVPVGLHDDAVVLLDLARGPGVLSTYGDRAAGRSFVQAVAAWLDLTGEAEVIVARGVHPRHQGPDLDSLLASLDGLAGERSRPVVVVCAAPDAEQAAQLGRMAADGLLRAVVAGQVPGHRWEIRVNSRGRAQAAGLGLTTDAAPLGPAVARTARKSRTAGRRGPAPATPGTPGTAPVPPPDGPPPGRVPPAREPVTARPAAARTAPAAPAGPVPVPAEPLPAPQTIAAEPVPEPHATPGPPPLRATTAGPAPLRAPAEPALEPPGSAVRELFAEPDITSVSAADARAATSSASPRTPAPPSPHEENRNES